MDSQDFTIGDYTLHDLQYSMLEIMKEIDRICKKHDIPYCLFYGTLIGAVRHKGFIPWDDDVDIAMLREDYEKFRKIAADEFQKPFCFQDYRNTHDHLWYYMRCYNSDTQLVLEGREHLHIQHGVFVEIFPLDNVDPKNLKLQQRLLASLNTVSLIKLKVARFQPKHILYAPLFLLPKKAINKLVDKIFIWNNKKDCDQVIQLCMMEADRPLYKKSDIADVVDCAFENCSFSIPKNAIDILNQTYRKHPPLTLPPEEMRHPTHHIRQIKL